MWDSNRRPQTASPEKIPFFSKIRGQFAPLPGDNPDRGVRLPTFFEKNSKISDRLRKNYEYTARKVFWKKSEHFAIFCVCTGWQKWGVGFFSEKCSFLLSVFQKTLNKGDEGWGAFIGGCRCRAPAGTVDSEKFLKFFLKSGAKIRLAWQ